MSHRVFRFQGKDRARLDEALADDILSRQSLYVRDGRHFGEKGDVLYVLVEGSDAGMLRAEAVLLEFGERAAHGEELWAKFKAEEEAALLGFGAVLGGGPNDPPT